MPDPASAAGAMAEGTEEATGRKVFDPPPGWNGVDPAKRWRDHKRELKLWALDSDLPLKKQGVIYLRSLQGDATEAVLLALEDGVIAAEDGLERIIMYFDKAYKGHMEITDDIDFDAALYKTKTAGTGKASEIVRIPCLARSSLSSRRTS